MNIILTPRAKKEIASLPKPLIEQILRKLHSVKDEPLRHLERLKGHSLWKLRIGDYRAIIFTNTKTSQMHVLMVGHRKNVYKQI